MVQPATTATTERAYAEIGHWRSRDEANGWSLLHLMNSYLKQLDTVEDLYRDDGDTPGWANVMDIDVVPATGIAWLAQFVGVSIPGGLTEVQQRQRATETAGFRRGTRAAIEGAARVHLTGAQQVITYERDDSPYHLTVRTYLAETPNAAKVAAALAEQKPAGLIITHQVATGADYGQLDTLHTTYAAMDTAYGTYENQTLFIP